MKIMVVSYGDDGHKNYFLETAQKAGVETLMFDAGSYPHLSDEIGFEYYGTPQLSLQIEGRRVHGSEIGGVWWRRPRGGKGENGGVEGTYSRYMHLEGEIVVRSLKDFTPSSNWVSDPEATRMACRKPVQLMVAKRLGWKIPDTCITNSPDLVKEFISFLNGKSMIMKPVGASFVEIIKTDETSGASDKVIFTQKVSPQLILEKIQMVRNCPVIFQEAVQKDSDMRVTVVDNDVFCAEITLEGCSNPDNVDWRNHDGIRVYNRHTLPSAIENLCISITRELGLRFGCIDLGYSRKDGYTFFEINPQGQWLPSEVKLGYPISAALLKALTR